MNGPRFPSEMYFMVFEFGASDVLRSSSGPRPSSGRSVPICDPHTRSTLYWSKNTGISRASSARYELEGGKVKNHHPKTGFVFIKRKAARTGHGFRLTAMRNAADYRTSQLKRL